MKPFQTGAALVELVVLTPFLITLIVGTAELGRAILQINTLNKALIGGARVVARFDNAINTADCSQGSAWAQATARGAAIIQYGPSGQGDLIMPGLDQNGAVVFSSGLSNAALPSSGSVGVCVVTVRSEIPFAALFGASLVPFVQLTPPNIGAKVEERYFGS